MAKIQTPSSLISSSLCFGRLTTESGVPISLSDRIAQSTIYFTPYFGNEVSLYNSGGWSRNSFTERSLALSSLTTGKNYDVFIYDNAGTLTLELSAAWTNDTTRADAITLQDGIYVKSGTTTRRYLGTIRTTGTTTTEDSIGGTTTQVGGKRFVWNYYNRTRRSLGVIDTANTWEYTVDTWRQANGAAGNKVEFVCGDSTPIHAQALSTVDLVAAGANTGIGIDSISSPSGLHQRALNSGGGHANDMPTNALHTGRIAAGYHYAAWLEKGAAGCTFYGDGAGSQSGLNAVIEN